MTAADPLVLTAARWGLVILLVAMVLAFFRIVYGPKNADRIIALDLLSVLVVAFVALYAVFSGEQAFLDVAIAYALVAFLGTVAFARYLERSAAVRRRQSNDQEPGERRE